MDSEIKKRKLDKDHVEDESEDKNIANTYTVLSSPTSSTVDSLSSVTESPDDCQLSPSGQRAPFKLNKSILKCSDSSSSKDSMGGKTTKKRQKKKIILQEQSYSTQFTGPEILFFFDLNYKQQPPPLDMINLPVVAIVEEILKFVYRDSDVPNGDEEFTKDGRNVSEIYSCHVKNYKWLSWMNDNDNLNFKECTNEDVDRKSNDILEQLDELPLEENKEISNVHDFLMYLHREYDESKCQNHDSWKHIFTNLQQILKFNDGNNSFISVRANGETVYNILYICPKNLISKGCTKVARYSNIKICPDSIYGTTFRRRRKDIGRIVMEVHRPKDGSGSSEDEVTKHTEHEKKKKWSDPYEKPERATDAIFLHSYRSKANNYLRQSIPYDCRDFHTTNKLTGQHALQLIGLADEHFRKNVQDNHKGLADDVSPTYRAIGMFLKNEYILFSKLKISKNQLLSYAHTAAHATSKIEEEGTISFSNWRLDVMKAKHRIALIVVLLEIFKPQEMTQPSGQ